MGRIVKKLINSSEMIEKEMLSDFLKANSNVEKVPSLNAIAVKSRERRVKIVVSGGIGCEPLYMGYVGENMADAVCLGRLFASPSAYNIFETSQYISEEEGILFVFGNYAGDFLNHDMACELLEDQGIKAACVIVKDDITSEKIQNKEERSGIAGIIWTIKIAAAAAKMGLKLDDVARIAKKATNQIYTVPVVLESGHSPVTGEAFFHVDEDKIEIGMGFNGEPGIEATNLITAKEIMTIVFNYLNNELKLSEGDEVCVMLNNSGNLTFLEMHIMYDCLYDRIRETGAVIYDNEIGRFLCPQDMTGFSVTLFKIDEELKKLYDLAVDTPAYKKRNEVCNVRG